MATRNFIKADSLGIIFPPPLSQSASFYPTSDAWDGGLVVSLCAEYENLVPSSGIASIIADERFRSK